MFLRKINFILITLFYCFVLFSSSKIQAANNSVNILAWWGYLDSPAIAKVVESQCNVNLSHDTYYTNNEFLRRVKSSKSNYDIIIFSQTIYNLYKNQIPKNDVNLAAFSNKFHPIIRKEYLRRKFPKNVIYFMHSLSGFLWNPEKLELTNERNIQSIFKKAGDNIVVLIDDPLEIWNLINKNFNNTNTNGYENSIPLTPRNFKRLIQNSNVYVANNFNQTYDQKNFAFAFGWSGDAIVYMKQANKKFKFLMHPDLSYISSDLLATMNDEPKTVCVAKALMSQKVLDIVQSSTFYFSPYGDYQAVNDPVYLSLYEKVFHELGNMPWLESSITPNDFEKMANSWNEIQLNLRTN